MEQTDKTTVQEWIVSVAPEIMEMQCDNCRVDRHDTHTPCVVCRVCATATERAVRKIGLADVLRALDTEKPHGISINSNGWFYARGRDGNWIGLSEYAWDLSADFDHQKPEVYSFLAQFVPKQ